MEIGVVLVAKNQMWNLQKSASDSTRILSKMALKDTDLWCLTAF